MRLTPLQTTALLLVGLFGLLALVLSLLPPSQERLPPLTVYSAEPNGGKALRLWLESIGYQLVTLERAPLALPTRARTLLLLEPTHPITGVERDTLEAWVRDGGRLVIAGEGLWTMRVLERFGLKLEPLALGALTARPAAGAPLDPAIGEVLVESDMALVGADASPLLVDGDHVLAASRPFGSGQVVALASVAALSNRALRLESNARLALSLIGRQGGELAVDELHHGYGEAQPRSLTRLLFDERWGQAVLYAGALVFGYLLLRGRRFGRPRPLDLSRGRSLGEYVSSVAALYRAGRKRAFLAEHFRRQLWRAYARSLGLPGDASEAQLVARARAAGRDPSALLDVARALEQGPRLGEAELIKLVRSGERALARSKR